MTRGAAVGEEVTIVEGEGREGGGQEKEEEADVMGRGEDCTQEIEGIDTEEGEEEEIEETEEIEGVSREGGGGREEAGTGTAETKENNGMILEDDNDETADDAAVEKEAEEG